MKCLRSRSIQTKSAHRSTILIHGNQTVAVTQLGKLKVAHVCFGKTSSCCLDNTHESKSISHENLRSSNGVQHTFWHISPSACCTKAIEDTTILEFHVPEFHVPEFHVASSLPHLLHHRLRVLLCCQEEEIQTGHCLKSCSIVWNQWLNLARCEMLCPLP